MQIKTYIWNSAIDAFSETFFTYLYNHIYHELL